MPAVHTAPDVPAPLPALVNCGAYAATLAAPTTQLRTLKAAAWLTAAVLELEKPLARRLNISARGR